MAFQIFCLLALITALTLAAQPRNPVLDVAPSIALQLPDFDLEGGFVRGALSDSLKQSLSIIEKAETLPACGKIATSALLHSCSDLEGSVRHNDELPAGSDLMIEEASDIYAARLAVCELSGADFSVPTECGSFIPAAKGKKRATLKAWVSSAGPPKFRVASDYYDEVTTANLNQCRKALGSSGQAWTSYSNNRQNAVMMCHAMQSAVERDESRQIAKILAHTAASTSQSLKDAHEHINEIKQQFHELHAAMPKFQQDLATFDEGIQQQYQEFWVQFGHARTGLESLNTAIGLTNSEMKEAHVHLEAALNVTIPMLQRAIESASKEISDTADTAAASAELMSYATQQTQQIFIAQLDAAGYSLAKINELVPQMTDRIEATASCSVSYLEAFVAREQELAVAQNKTIAGMELMQQKTEHVVSDMEGLSTKMSEFKTDVTDTIGQFETLAEYLGILAPVLKFVVKHLAIGACTLIVGLFVFGHLAGGLVRAFAHAAGVSIGFAFALCFASDLLASSADQVAEVARSTWLDAPNPVRFSIIGAGVCIAYALVTAVVRHIFRSTRALSSADDLYDPCSPPSGIEAWKIWLLDSPAFRREEPCSRSTSLPRSRV